MICSVVLLNLLRIYGIYSGIFTGDMKLIKDAFQGIIDSALDFLFALLRC